MHISTSLATSLSPTNLLQLQLVQPEDQHSQIQDLSDKLVVVQFDLHKLADAAFNQSATIPSKEQSELAIPQVPDNDTVAGHLKLDDFCCLISSSSSSDSSGSTKSSTSSSTSNISLDHKVADIIPRTDSQWSSPKYLNSNSNDDRYNNTAINSASIVLLDSSVDLPTVISSVNLFIRIVQDNFVTTTAAPTIQKTECQLVVVHSQIAQL